MVTREPTEKQPGRRASGHPTTRTCRATQFDMHPAASTILDAVPLNRAKVELGRRHDLRDLHTIPLYTAEPWSERTRDFSSGNANAQLCAVVTRAATILHELTHFCIRQFCVEDKDLGGHAEKAPFCWDEARMMGSGFKWSMGALCPSVLGPLDCCPYGDPWMFFRSAKVAGRPSCAGQDTFFRPCP